MEVLLIIVVVVYAVVWCVRKANEAREAIENNKRLIEQNKTFNMQIQEQQRNLDIITHTMNEKTQSFPWLAELYAESLAVYDLKRSNITPGGATARENRKVLISEKKSLVAKAKMLEYQLRYYEAVFPWLEEFKEIPPVEAWESVHSEPEKSDYEHYRNYLSPDEYSNLSDSDKFQLALDRYKKRRKNNWLIGIEYERYIGYLYESKGWRVEYSGACLGLEDMGRDLICSKPGQDTLIIQCKRWSQTKTLHEKHIFQLYGSCVAWQIINKQAAIGCLTTTASLSPIAEQCAEYLGILVHQNQIMDDYPLIKCNIGKNHEKIYHFPFDQQYDKVVIEPEKGEGYVWTVKEAERLGFRRAFRWSAY